MHRAQAGVVQRVHYTCWRPINDGGDGHCVRMLPLITGQICKVLPHKSCNDSVVIEDLEWEDRRASLIRSVVKLKVMITHSQKTKVVIPIGGHVRLCLCQRYADQEGVDKVSCGEPGHLTHPHVLHIDWLC